MNGPALTVAIALVLISGATVWWLRRRYVAVDVTGRSMEPTLHDGDRVLVRRAPLAEVSTGRLVVLRLPGGPRWAIKRVAAVPGEPIPWPHSGPARTVPPGHLVVVGDNTEASYDSRQFGPVPAGTLLGVAVGRLGNHRRHRRGAVPRTPAGAGEASAGRTTTATPVAAEASPRDGQTERIV